jgi:hypothetical protein
MKIEATCFSKTSLDNRLHGIISQKIELQIVSAMRTSNLILKSCAEKNIELSLWQMGRSHMAAVFLLWI